MDTTSAPPCLQCGKDFAGRYCPECGERRVDRHEYSVRHQVEELIEGLTHFDLRIFRSLWALVAMPGLLTAEHLRGHRRPWLGPVQLFFWINVLFFVLSGMIGFVGLLLVPRCIWLSPSDGPCLRAGGGLRR
jgi:hypothetical protein